MKMRSLSAAEQYKRAAHYQLGRRGTDQAEAGRPGADRKEAALAGQRERRSLWLEERRNRSNPTTGRIHMQAHNHMRANMSAIPRDQGRTRDRKSVV